MNRHFRFIKPEIRVLGIDDCIFTPHTKGEVDVIGVVYRGNRCLDGVMRTQIEIDGMDATDKIINMIMNSPHYKQLRVIMLNGVTLAGLNIVDIKTLFKKTELPVIVIMRKKPNMKKIKEALKNLPHSEHRWKTIRNAGRIFKTYIKNTEEPIYIQTSGVTKEDAEKILKQTTAYSNLPEALRVAHIIASGLSKMQNRTL